MRKSAIKSPAGVPPKEETVSVPTCWDAQLWRKASFHNHTQRLGKAALRESVRESVRERRDVRDKDENS
jgi:hypothetical protein